MDELSAAKKQLLAERLQGKRGRLKQPSSAISKRPLETPNLATPNQQHIWLMSQIQEASPSYNITSSFYIRGTLDVERLNQSVQSVIQRHSILRSHYHTEGDILIQTVDDEFDFQVETFELNAKTSTIEKLAQAEASKPINITQGPLFRLLLFTQETGPSLITLVIHDLIFDKWSLGIFWKEISAFYQGEALIPLSIQYDDFAHWQRTWLQSADAQKQLHFWREELKDLPQPLPLPTDSPYPETINDQGKLAQRPLPASLSKQIHDLASQTQTSPFVLCLLGFNLLLRRYCQEDDLLIATPVANRRQKETAALIGFFLNTLPIRIRLNEKQSVTDALVSLRAHTLELISQQDIPLHHITEGIDIPRVAGRHPLCQVMLVYQREAEAQPPIQLGNTDIEHTIIDICTSKFDLTLFVAEQADHLNCVLEYRSDLFQESTASRILEHFESIMLAMTTTPDQALSEIYPLSDTEAHNLEKFQTGPQSTIDTSKLTFDHILDQAAQVPHSIALEDKQRSYSYQELTQSSKTLAAQLQSMGVKEGDVVGLYMDKSIEAIIALLAILQSGATYLPIDPSYPIKRTQFMLEDSQAHSLLTQLKHKAALEEISDLPILFVDSEHINTAENFTPSNATADTPAYIIYTSGTTGQPKGVSITHGNLLHSTLARHRYYTKKPNNFLLLPNLTFDSSIAGIFWTLTTGGTLVIPNSEEIRDPERCLQLIKDRQVDSLLGVPTLYHHLLAYDHAVLQCLHTVIVAGETCAHSLLQKHLTQCPDTALYNEYGPTEGTVWASVHQCTLKDLDRTNIPIGKPIENTQLYILNPQQKPVPPGLIGEIYISGPNVAAAYLNQPELSAQAFVQLNENIVAYRTGDLGKWLNDGTIEFSGRIDQQIKLNGYRIEVEEIEKQLELDPSVQQAVVIAQAVEDKTKTLYDLASSVSPSILSELIEQVKAEGPTTTRSSKNDAFTLQLESSDPAFIATPRKAQRDWLIGQAMAEFTDDLNYLNTIAPNFVTGYDHKIDEDLVDITNEALSQDAIMEDWQQPIMQAMARYACESHGDVLEIGFGRGVSAEMIQQEGVRSHTIVEINPHSISHYFTPWRNKHADKKIILHADSWQAVEPTLPLYDAIFFHAFPLNETEFSEYVLNSVTFAEHSFPYMAKHLREGGVFTYLTTEIDSLSRRHQRLLFKYFKTISFHVETLKIPEDTRDTWWAPSMVVIKAIK